MSIVFIVQAVAEPVSSPRTVPHGRKVVLGAPVPVGHVGALCTLSAISAARFTFVAAERGICSTNSTDLGTL
jgi:hypothetical protein